MKHLSFDYKNTIELKRATKEAQKSCYTAQLIQLFTASTQPKKIEKILTKLAKKFPKATIIGTTTAGEISHGKLYDNSSIVSISLFKETKLQATYVKNITKKTAQKMTKAISLQDTKALIVFSEGLNGKDYEGFIQHLQSDKKKFLISGGLAGDNFQLKQTYIFLNGKIYDKGSVGVSLSSKKLFVQNRYNLNWTPIGKKFTLTKVDGNKIYEIDGENAVSLFKKYLGKEIFDNNATALPDFQLLYKEGNTLVARTPLGVENGNAIVTAAPVKEGQKFQFGFSNATAVVHGSNLISNDLAKNKIEAIYLYSCIARKTLLGKELEQEFTAFENLAPTTGFFTYGEFYSADTNNTLLNCTTTILALSEESKKMKKRERKTFNTDAVSENITFNALTHFIERTSLDLHENAELLNQYKEAVDVTSLISKTDVHGTLTYVNENFCRVSKYAKEELIGHNHNIVRNPEVPDLLFKKMWQTIEKGDIYRGSFSNRAKDGSLYYVDATIIPLFDEYGKVKEYMGIRQDITKQMQATQKIQEKERLIKAIFDNQDSVVIYASRDKKMLYANRKLFEYINFTTLDEFRAKHSCICDLFEEEEGYIYTKKYPNWIADIEQHKIAEEKVKIVAKDGKAHIFHISVSQINREYIINLNDITILEEALKKAHLSEQTKSLFLANMSHEIRTPLNGILGFTDILSKKEFDTETKRYIDIINKSGQTLLNVVNDILDFSKLESGELVIAPTEANLFDEMEAAVATFASVAKNKQLHYLTYIDTNIPTILQCDVQRIKQVLTNLISNAIKFTPQEGTVYVSIELKKQEENKAYITVSVTDTGIGIKEEKIDTIFDAFSQADNSISREFGGTGLGLSISSQYIKMMDSQLQVKSDYGKGSEFYFTIALPIIKNEYKYNTLLNKKGIHIQLMQNDDKDICGINNIVKNYLDTWHSNYNEIYSFENVTAQTDILIICAKLFNKTQCTKALEKYKGLHLIFIEDTQTHIECNHKRFYPLEQPLTGSMLFDKIISLTHSKHPIDTQSTKTPQTQRYEGNLLVAEDNETNQMLISIMLEERGIHFSIVNNGQEAVEVALQKNYDLIFMDINMPILDGISATKELREKGYTKPIVSLSANVIESDKISFREAGMNDTLNKPLVPKELDAILEKYLQAPKIQEQESVSIEGDNIDIENIAKQLGIPNQTVIKTLLSNFGITAQKICQKLQEEPINPEILHTLKGVSGNMRFEKLYKLTQEVEADFKNLSQEERERYTAIFVAHLKHLELEIEKLA